LFSFGLDFQTPRTARRKRVVKVLAFAVSRVHVHVSPRVRDAVVDLLVGTRSVGMFLKNTI